LLSKLIQYFAKSIGIWQKIGQIIISKVNIQRKGTTANQKTKKYFLKLRG